MRHFDLGEKVIVFSFIRRLGKRSRCSMCYIEIPWYETGIKIVSSQKNGHLAFHQDCFDEFLEKLNVIRGELK